ncbi:hypothetical protein Ato02nite_093340 [Paractinoplanes toevensis]|uniref:Uncharacterized protein n=1 Tax=Paractinoplanes toevensis TaxID=571911 RepID=A0A919WCB1_9ACTN|nr:hypothetical protein Ato02nite_093340 [Actinoplanes toevensis]
MARQLLLARQLRMSLGPWWALKLRMRLSPWLALRLRVPVAPRGRRRRRWAPGQRSRRFGMRGRAERALRPFPATEAALSRRGLVMPVPKRSGC